MSFMRNFWGSDTMRDFLARGGDGAGGVSTPATNGAVAKHAPGLANGALPVKPTAPAQSPPGNSASDQAQLTKRLGALVGPYKEAVSKNAPEAAQMQTLMVAVKQRIVERNFLAAGQALDELEPLVEQYKGSKGNDKVSNGDAPTIQKALGDGRGSHDDDSPLAMPSMTALVVEAPNPGSNAIPGASRITFTPNALWPDVSTGSVTANFGNGRAASVEIAAGASGRLMLIMTIDGVQFDQTWVERFKQTITLSWDVSADDTGALTIDTPAVDIGAPTTGTWYRLDSVNPASGKSFVQVSPIIVGASVSGSLNPLGVGIGQQSQPPKIQNTFRIDIKVKVPEPKGTVTVPDEVTAITGFEYTVGPFKSGLASVLDSGSIKKKLYDLLYKELPEETRHEILHGQPAGGEKIEVHGFASNKDTEIRNFELSKARANAVITEFMSLGVSASLFTEPHPHGEWESNPTDNPKEEIDDPDWRKVVIKIQHGMTFKKNPKTGEMDRTK